jgi:imidazolonepropionase-like amidohydrolase
MKLLHVIVVLFVTIVAQGQQNGKKILLENATVHIGNGQVIYNGLVGIQNNSIILVKNALAYTYNPNDWDSIIQLNGHHIYPGFVAPNTTLGLTEIDAVRATRDFDEVGTFNPHVRSQIAYNCESAILATVRTNGVLITQATPRGGIISGTSSVMRTACWNWEDGTLLADDGIHLNWPSSLKGGEWWSDNKVVTRNDQYEERKRQITNFFAQAETYQHEAGKAADLKFEAMKACFNGSKRVYFHADELQQLLDIVDFVSAFRLKNAVIIGGYDSYLITEKLKEHHISVMLPRVHSLPEKDDDAVDLVYRLPYLLQQGGVLFCLQNEGDMDAMNVRNLPFLAGTAMAYGLSEEEAVQSITLNACRILGIDHYYGSIEVGKRASLFVSTGNALDMRTNNARMILSDGMFLPVTNFQTDLYLKYRKKYGF